MDSRSIVSLGALMIMVSVGIAFYWYEYRPSQIRAACETQSTEPCTRQAAPPLTAQQHLPPQADGNGGYCDPTPIHIGSGAVTIVTPLRPCPGAIQVHQ